MTNITAGRKPLSTEELARLNDNRQTGGQFGFAPPKTAADITLSFDTPATVKENRYGRYHFDADGSLHREDGPAVENHNGARSWYTHGVVTKTIRADGTVMFFDEDGNLHSEDGPAVTFADGGEQWLINGKLHRTDGPALTRPDGSSENWVDGVHISSAEVAA